MIILFTGHRDTLSQESELERILTEYPDAHWIHGGATGFDSQVKQFALQRGIAQTVYPPDYDKHGAAAPLVRNKQMVELCDMVCARYDGRMRGGTYHTIRKAKEHHKPILYLKGNNE